jgi:uncharacterized protein
MRASYRIALILVIAGGLNWLMIGAFKLDLVAAVFGGVDKLPSRLAYTLIGLCALYCVMLLKPGRPPGSALNTSPYEPPAARPLGS